VDVDFAVLVSSAPTGAAADPAAISTALSTAAADGTLNTQIAAKPAVRAAVIGLADVRSVAVETAIAPSASPTPSPSTGAPPGRIVTDDFTGAYAVVGVIAGLVAIALIFFAARRCFAPQPAVEPERAGTGSAGATAPAERVQEW